MVKIELKSLHFINFQSFKDRKFEFDDITNIFGENATGKTTVKRGLKWLLFGKDENDRTDSGRNSFNLKPLDENGEIIHGLETSVEGEFFINGNLKTLKRMFVENWTKPRGKSKSILSGNQTKFWVDGIPFLAGQYQKEINLIIDETLFKLITDPLYFSLILTWKDRIKILEKLFEEITVDEIVSKDSELESIRELLIKNDFDDLQKKFATEKTEFNKEIEKIPIIINEKQSEIVEDDFDFIKHDLKNKEKKLTAIEDQLTDATKENPVLAEKKKELNVLRSKINKIETDITEQRYSESKKLSSALRKHQSDKTEEESSLKEINDKVASLKIKKDVLKNEIKKTAEAWDLKKAEQFVINEDFICPTCKRKLDADVIEKKKAELQENFNQAKAKALQTLSADGKDLTQQKTDIENQLHERENLKYATEKAIEELTNKITEAQKAITNFENTDPEYPDEYWTLRAQVDEITEIINTPADSSIDVNDLRSRKAELIKEIDLIKTELRAEENNIKIRKRINELEKSERDIAQKIVDIENNEFLCEKFIRIKTEILNKRITSQIKSVRFKLFNKQINGGINLTCEPLINGIPFSDANNAARVNSGIEIINAISKHHKISAPFFIDNRESINEIIQTDAQVINLIVSTDKNLVVKSAESALQVA